MNLTHVQRRRGERNPLTRRGKIKKSERRGLPNIRKKRTSFGTKIKSNEMGQEITLGGKEKGWG